MTEETNKNGPDADAAEAYAAESQEDQAQEASTEGEGDALDALRAENA